MKEKKLLELKEFINSHNITQLSRETPLFGGADICIVEKEPKANNGFYPDPQYVVTSYAKELSWLIFELGVIFKNDLDHINKYEFYGKLAEKANDVLRRRDCNLNTLLHEVIDEAIQMNKGLNIP